HAHTPHPHTRTHPRTHTHTHAHTHTHIMHTQALHINPALVHDSGMSHHPKPPHTHTHTHAHFRTHTLCTHTQELILIQLRWTIRVCSINQSPLALTHTQTHTDRESLSKLSC